jgi:hypothetical protein
MFSETARLRENGLLEIRGMLNFSLQLSPETFFTPINI